MQTNESQTRCESDATIRDIFPNTGEPAVAACRTNSREQHNAAAGRLDARARGEIAPENSTINPIGQGQWRRVSNEEDEGQAGID